MNVLVPLNNLDHLTQYVEAGAREFYIGFYCDAWTEQFGAYADLNRLSGYEKEANTYSFEEILAMVPKVKETGSSIYITFNSSVYSEEQVQYMRRYFEQLKQVGVDGVIVSCIELVTLAKECGVDSVASTICGIYNSDIARFYYEAGARRLILPRDLSIEEVCSIMQAVPEVEYEVFMMRNGCTFSDANCLGLHRLKNCAICASLRKGLHELYMKNKQKGHQEEVKENDRLFTKEFHKYSCGLCSIYDFVKVGVKAGKIVGRTDDWEDVCRDIRLVCENVQIAKNCETKEAYLEAMVRGEYENGICEDGMSCYYPEVRFGN